MTSDPLAAFRAAPVEDIIIIIFLYFLLKIHRSAPNAEQNTL